MSHNVWVTRDGSNDVDAVYRRDQPALTTTKLLNTHADVVAFEAERQTVEDDEKKVAYMPSVTTANRPSAVGRKTAFFWDDTEAEPCYSDGTDWRRFSDGTVVT